MTTQLKKSIAVGVATVMIAALAVVFVVGRGGGSTASAAGQGPRSGGPPASAGSFADFAGVHGEERRDADARDASGLP
jgi:hypothetical protein